MPIPADYDGDGKADLAVFHPADGSFHIRGSSTPERVVLSGQPGDTALAAPLSPYRTNIITGTGGPGTPGNPGGLASTIGDYDGDGKTDLAIYDQTDSRLIALLSNRDLTGNIDLIQQFGDPSHTNVPVSGDYDGDGKTDLGIYDQTDSKLIVLLSNRAVTGNMSLIQQFGDPSHRTSRSPATTTATARPTWASTTRPTRSSSSC